MQLHPSCVVETQVGRGTHRRVTYLKFTKDELDAIYQVFNQLRLPVDEEVMGEEIMRTFNVCKSRQEDSIDKQIMTDTFFNELTRNIYAGHAVSYSLHDYRTKNKFTPALNDIVDVAKIETKRINEELEKVNKVFLMTDCEKEKYLSCQR